MKTKITSLLLFCNLLCMGFLAVGQCPPNSITTNPAAPVNNQLPSKTNLYFDWRLPNYSNNSTCQPLLQVESPFFKIDDIEILRSSKDMAAEDGWELLRREMGYTDANVPKVETPEHMYVVLYNKYRGILRVLLKSCRGADYSGAKITIKFDSNITFQTGLLDFTSILRSLDQPHVAAPKGQSFSPFLNDKTKWFYGDFAIAYDPCTCNYQSKINILSHLIQDSQIALGGSLNGSITSVAGGQGTVKNDGSYSFKDFANDADKFKKVYNGVDNFITETKNVAATIPGSANTVSALTSFQSGLKDLQFLKTGLAAVPWIGAAVSVLDMFTGGGKASPQQVEIMPMAVSLSLKVTGTMSTANQYHNIIFSNPGSLNATLDPDIYPFYNEVLGVFNLLNGPKFRRYSDLKDGTHPKWTRTVGYRLISPIKWVINPASGLELQDAQVAYIALSNNSTATPPAAIGAGFSTLEGKDAVTGKWEYRTAYIDINCLANDHIFKWVDYSTGSSAPTQFYMKIILNLKNINNPSAQNTLIVLKYPIITAISGTDLISGIAFNPSACLGGYFVKATPTDVTTFCSSSGYLQNRNSSGGREKASPKTQETNNQSIYPNPATSTLVISKDKFDRDISSIVIHNLMGAQVYANTQFDSNTPDEFIDINSFASGIYLVTVNFEDGEQIIERVLINH